MYCFTRKTLVGANRVRIQLLRVKPIVLRVKQKDYYILMYCFTRKVNCFTRKTRVLRVKHYINDPSGHKLQTTLINVTKNKWFYYRFTRKTFEFTRKTFHFTRKTVGFKRKTTEVKYSIIFAFTHVKNGAHLSDTFLCSKTSKSLVRGHAD